MTGTIAALLLVVLVLEVKHFLCDYPLQTAYQLNNKGTYGHPGGLIHAGVHALGTSAAFLVITPTPAVGAAILAAEFVVHYHIDWSKDHVMRVNKWTAKDNPFWWTIGIDQLLHHLTYLAIAAALVAWR